MESSTEQTIVNMIGKTILRTCRTIIVILLMELARVTNLNLEARPTSNGDCQGSDPETRSTTNEDYQGFDPEVSQPWQ